MANVVLSFFSTDKERSISVFENIESDLVFRFDHIDDPGAFNYLILDIDTCVKLSKELKRQIASAKNHKLIKSDDNG